MLRSLVTFSFVAVLTALTASASAQSTEPGCHHGRGGRGGPEARVDFLIHALGLDEHQAATVRQIMEDTRPERERIRAMAPGSAEQIAAREQLETQTHARIDAVLDDTQRAQLTRMREWRQSHRGEWRGHGGPGHPGRGAPPSGI
jgi:Spy/CpxP family protein refolding chaperone